MNTLKAKIMLFVLALATLAAIPMKLSAFGNPQPQCGGMVCPPPNAN